MNYYEKNINSFLASVASNMSAVYLPAFFISLINLLEDYYKFDVIRDENYIKTNKTKVIISYSVATAYFLSYLLNIRKHIPRIKMAPVRGKTHDERFVAGTENIDGLLTAGQIMNHSLFLERGNKIITNMKSPENIYQVFEKRCPILQLKKSCIEMDIVAVDTLLTNSILYSKMGELVCYQYLSKLSANSALVSQIETYFLRGGERANFPTVAKDHVISYQENKCYYCGRTLNKNEFVARPRADHFIPWVFVKNSLVENLVYACNDCNSRKLDSLPNVAIFNKLLQRNAPGSDFWLEYPDIVANLEQRINRWTRNYYQASEQLSTGWIPGNNCKYSI